MLRNPLDRVASGQEAEDIGNHDARPGDHWLAMTNFGVDDEEEVIMSGNQSSGINVEGVGGEFKACQANRGLRGPRGEGFGT